MNKLIFFLFFISPFLALASDKIILNVGENGYPPYMIYNEKGVSRGIMVDVFKLICDKIGKKYKIVGYPRKRTKFLLNRGDIDATVRAKEWVKKPENYHFSDVIVPHRDIIIFEKTSKLKFTNIESLYRKKIATHRGYRYPLFEKSFKEGKIKRNDLDSEHAILSKVLQHHVDAGIINESIAHWYIMMNGWAGKFRMSEKDVGNVGYRIMFNKKWTDFVKRFDRELAEMKKNKSLDRIIKKYRYAEKP